MTSKIRPVVLFTALVASSIALAGCTINIGAQPPAGGSNGMMGQNDSGFSGTDVMFAQMMIPHHQQAVDMGNLAETRASNPEVKALALQIRDEQAPEIAQMKGWLKAAGVAEDMGHAMPMDGMLSDVEMADLTDARGAAFDKLYVAGMISHHEGAIQMAQMVLDSSNAEAKALGEAIVKSQTAQVATLKALLAKLG